MRAEMEEVLTEAGLDSIMVGLGKAGITSSHTLRLHTLREVEESLQRPTAYGRKFCLSEFQRRALDSLGLADSVRLRPNQPAATRPAAAPGAEGGASALGDAALIAESFSLEGILPPSGPQPRPHVETAAAAALSGSVRMAKLFEGCQLSAELLGSAMPESLTAEAIDGLANSFAKSCGREARACGTSAEEAVDQLDVQLAALIRRGELERGELKPPTAGWRGVSRHASALLLLVEERHAQAKSSPSQDTAAEQLNAVKSAFLVSQNPRLSPADEKVAAELNASQSRLDAVVAAASARSALQELSAGSWRALRQTRTR